MTVIVNKFKSNHGPFEFRIKESLVLVIDEDGIVPKYPIVSRNANYTLVETDVAVLVDTSAGPVTVFLPELPVEGQTHFIKKSTSNANTLTVSGNGNLIDGQASIGTGATVDLVSLRLHYGNGEWHDL